MDKNTLYGLLLMGLVIFGFMWLQQPSKEQLEAQRAQQEQLKAEQAKSDVESDAVLSVDSVTPQEIEIIKNTVKEYGEQADGSWRVKNPQMTVVLTSEGQLEGSVVTPDGTVTVQQIISHSYGDIKPSLAAAAVKEFRQQMAQMAKQGVFAKYTSGDSTVVTLKNDVLSVDIANKGAMIARATLLDKRYINYKDSAQVELLSPEYGDYGFTLTSSAQGQRYDSRDFYFSPVEKTDTSVVMSLDLGDGAVWAIRYSLAPGESYLVRMEMQQQGMNKIIPASETSMEFDWNQRMPQNEAGRVFEQRNSGLYYQYSSGDVDNLSEAKDDSEELNERVRWIGFKNQFFSAVVIADQPFTSANVESTVIDNGDYIKTMNAVATADYNSKSANPASYTFYFGPNLYPLLNDIEDEIVPEADLNLTKLVPLGWSLFRWINTLIIIPVFTFLGHFISNYGIIILLLTIFIKLVIFPFTYKSYLSQARMRVLGPEIKAINDKYPGQENAMKRQQETMAVYSKAGVNPMSGCVPLLFQMPILIAMFNFFPSAIELRGQSFLWAHDLSAPDAIVSWTTHIPLISTYFGNHISLFCLLMTVTNVIYSWISMQSQPGGNTMPGMKWMTMLMPVMFLVVFNNYAAGLSYYYFLSLLITIVQMWVFRKVINEDKVRAKMAAAAKKPKKKSGFMARLEEAQRQQQQMLREQQRQQAKGKRR